jgi:hypothetical protein
MAPTQFAICELGGFGKLANCGVSGARPSVHRLGIESMSHWVPRAALADAQLPDIGDLDLVSTGAALGTVLAGAYSS